MVFRISVLSVLLPLFCPGFVTAQDTTTTQSRGDALRVYLDCNSCDFDYMRTEIAFVNYVRDRQAAQLHILVSTQETGGGGREFTLKFIGLERFVGVEDELKYVSNATETQNDRRTALAQVLKLGLVRYVARLPMGRKLTVTYQPDTAQSGPAQKPHDPWNNWVFSLGGNGNFSGQSLLTTSNIFGSVSANRVTEDWKVGLSVFGSRNKSTYELDSLTTIRSKTSSYAANGYLARSLGSHWSIGMSGGASSSSVDNEDLVVQGGPTIEFSFFNYKESTRRLLTLQYSVSVIRSRFADSTIFDVLKETKAKQFLTFGLDATQPWGSANFGVTGSTYLDHFAENRISVFGGGNFRLIKGLSFNIFGSIARVRDQRSIAKANITDTDVLLRLKQLKTSFDYFTFFGLNYTFGSIYNSIVNPRLRGIGGGGRSFSFNF